MKKLLVLILTAGLIMYPFAASSVDYGSQPSANQQAPPPVAQTLVREGDFAVKLAAKLDLGSPREESDAEAMLAEAGVVPLNGWLSDYPVTPEIVGQLQSAVAKAASEGKLPMTADEAGRGISSLVAEANLPTPAGPGSAPGEAQNTPAIAQSNPTVINNYYYDQGPPIVTYYPPPVDYVYLYDWVPYPVWWFGFWFPGFYICHTFTTVVVSGPFIEHREHRFERRHLVTNHVIDPITRTRVLVSPVAATSNGQIKPMTLLRTENGERFRTLADVRQHAGMTGIRDVRPGSVLNRDPRARRSGPFDAGKSAGAIYSRSMQNGGRGPDNVMTRGDGRRTPESRLNERTYRPPQPQGNEGGGSRSSTSPGTRDRPYANSWTRGGQGERPLLSPGLSERQFNAPAIIHEQRSFAPGGSSRASNAPVFRDRNESGTTNNGWLGREGNGREGFGNGNTCRGRWC